MATPLPPPTLDTTIQQLPNEILQRVFNFLDLESKLSAGLTCRRWLDILRPAFVHLTDILLSFEDDYCHLSSVVRVHRSSNSNYGDTPRSSKKQKSMVVDEEGGSGMLTVNLCACPQHLSGHRNSFEIILMASGRYVKKLIAEDYLLQKGCFVDGDLLATFASKCPKLSDVEFHHVDLSRMSEKGLLEIFRPARLTELFLDQCSWASWTETGMNRVLKAIVARAVHLREIHVTGCSLLNDRSLQFIAKNCMWLWYIDFSGCRSITANGLSHFFYYMQQRQSDLLYIKIHKTRIDGSELQHLLYSGQQFGGGGGPAYQFIDDRQWAVCNFVMETGHRACSFQNRHIPGKTIIIFM